MQDEHHNLVNEFPEYKDKIHEMKMNNAHFQRLMDEHHQIDKQVRQAEANTTPMCDENIEDLKKKRLKLQDALFDMLKNS